MRRILPSVLAVALASGLAPAAASAQTQLCVPGPVACAGIQVLTSAASGGGTSVSVIVQNLQGTAGLAAIPNSSAIFAVYAQFGSDLVAEIGATPTGATPEPGVDVFGAPGGAYWEVLGESNSILLDFAFGSSTVIEGCAATPYQGALSTYSTCGPSEFVTFTFTSAQAFAGADLLGVGLLAASFDPATGDAYLGCNVPGDDIFAPFDQGACVAPLAAAVVPEPGTWLLLGTGMAGLLGLGAVRRRAT